MHVVHVVGRRTAPVGHAAPGARRGGAPDLLVPDEVLDAELGVLPIDDVKLSPMKREKLAAKDRLTRMYDASHH